MFSTVRHAVHTVRLNHFIGAFFSIEYMMKQKSNLYKNTMNFKKMSLNRNQIIFASDMSLRRLLQEHIWNAICLVQTH